MSIALKIAADIFAGTDHRRAEATELREHVGHIDDIEFIHQLAVEDLRIERGFTEQGVGAGDRIGVGGVVGVGGVSFDFEDIEQDGLLLLFLFLFRGDNLGGGIFGGGCCGGRSSGGRRDGLGAQGGGEQKRQSGEGEEQRGASGVVHEVGLVGLK